MAISLICQLLNDPLNQIENKIQPLQQQAQYDH